MKQQAVLLAQVFGLPDGSVRAEVMPGLEPNEAVAMCNTAIQALAARQAQFINVEAVSKPKILVPKMVLGGQL